MSQKMPAAPRGLRDEFSGLVGLCLCLCLGLIQCERVPILVLNIHVANEANILVRTQLNGVVAKDQIVPGFRQRIQITLPEDASGSVRIDLFGLNEMGCKISQGTVQKDVPGGLSRATEESVTLSPLSPILCTLTINVQSGGSSSATGTVVSAPGGINCSSGSCSADFPVGSGPLVLTASFAAGNYVQWSGPCANAAATCRLPMDTSQTLDATFWPLTCGTSGWCSENPALQNNALRAVFGIPNTTEAIAIGDAGTVLHCQKALCSKMATTATQNLRSVWVADANHIYAAGDGGTILRCSATTDTCTLLNSGTMQPLRTVIGSDVNNVYVGGDGGTIVRCNGDLSNCMQLTSDTTQNLFAAWAVDPTHVYVGGSSGGLVVCTATNSICTTLTSNTTQQINGIWGNDSNQLWVVTDGGAVGMCTSNVCSMVQTTGPRMSSVFGSNASNVYAVGDGGTVLRCSSSPISCSALMANSTQSLQSVFALDASAIYAVGTGGTILQCSNSSTSCTPQNSAVTQKLNGIWGSAANHVYSVGDGGTVLYLGQ